MTSVPDQIRPSEFVRAPLIKTSVPDQIRLSEFARAPLTRSKR